jgi:hypothetical protein
MKAPYRVTFADGSTEEVEADNPSQAKLDAQNARIRSVDPGGTMFPADRKTHARVKVSSVAEIIGAAARATSDILRDRQRSRDTERDDRQTTQRDRNDREREQSDRIERDERGERERLDRNDRDERGRTDRDSGRQA